VVVVVAACAGPDVAPPVVPQAPKPLDAAISSPLPPDAEPDAAIDAPVDAPPPPPEPEVWLKGSTHVHAKPSGDSSEPIPDVVQWYEDRGYDFIAITDHNQVTEDGADTTNQVATHTGKLIVLAGVELTHNPSGCLPPGDKSRKCRIHVNALGVTSRPTGKIEWAERHSHERIDMYQAALTTAHALGAQVVQVNHPQWFWGMTADLLFEIAKRGAKLVEIDNAQFRKWSKGDKDHPSMEKIWDGALGQGAILWGVASDDAHDYEEHDHHKGKYPAGGAWVVVKARRDPQAILDALAAGHFYASNGVVLTRDDIDGDDYVIETEPGKYTIDWIENGKKVASVKGTTARHALPETGYLRADITRADGAQAWVQPARR
jgi:hypothetical protein